MKTLVPLDELMFINGQLQFKDEYFRSLFGRITVVFSQDEWHFANETYIRYWRWVMNDPFEAEQMIDVVAFYDHLIPILAVVDMSEDAAIIAKMMWVYPYDGVLRNA